MSFNLSSQKESDPMIARFFSAFWTVQFDRESGIFILSDQGGFVPTHDQLLNIIQELCNTYDVLSVETVSITNETVYRKNFGEPSQLSLKPRPIKKTAPPLNGFVYLVRLGQTSKYKIGLSTDPIKRLCQLQTSTPDELSLSRAIATNDMVRLEAYFHKSFAHSRLRGEWFELTQDDIAEFMDHEEIV